MKKLSISAFALAGLAALATLASPVSMSAASAAEAKNAKPLRGVVRPYKRIGGYSYKYVDSINTRKFTDPTVTSQTIGGPFDSGFFFSTPAAPHGGDSPYMQ